MSQGGINSVTSGVLPPDVPLQFTADVGVAVPAASNLNIFGGTATNTVGAGSTITINMDVPVTVPNGGTGQITLTNHGVLVGAGINPITQLAVGNTNTVLLGNTGADPSFGQVPTAALVSSTITLNNGNNITVTGSPVSLGGAATFNITGTTINCVQLGNGGGSLTSLANGTTGQVLTAQTGIDPIWAAPAASSISITGDTGGAQVGNAFTFAGGTTGLSFGGAAGTFTTTFAGITANGGTVNLATDATASAINIGTGAGAKTTILGSTNSTSITTLQSGTGALSITSTNGALTMNSGTGNLTISGDATATIISIGFTATNKNIRIGNTSGTTGVSISGGTTNPGGVAITTNGTPIDIENIGAAGVINIGNGGSSTNTINIGTGAAVKTVTVGSTNTTSPTVIQSGTGNIIHNTGFRVDSTGRTTNPNQPMFFAYLSATTAALTGNATLVSAIVWNTEVFDQGGNFNTGTGTFTAPVTGKYVFCCQVRMGGIAAGQTHGFIALTTTAATYRTMLNPFITQSSAAEVSSGTSVVLSMTAADTAVLGFQVTGGALTVTAVSGGAAAPSSWFSGQLVA